MEELERRQKGDNSRAEGDDPVSSRKAAGYVAYAAAGRHRQTVGYLCGDMGDVVAARARRRHYGGVGNGRAVVAEHAACKRRPPRLLSFLFISLP